MSSKHPSKEAEPTNQNTQPENTTTTTTTTKNKEKEQQPSLVSRIQNSASSLIQDSLTKPRGATLSSDLAHVLDSGNKGSSSASFSGSTYSGQTWRSNGLGNGGLSLGDQNDYTPGMSSEGFRSSQADGGRGFDASEFDSFQNTGGFFQDAFIPETSNKGKGKSREQPIPNAYDNNLEQDMMISEINEYESTHFSSYEIAWINASRLGTVYRSTTSTPSKRLSQSSKSEISPSAPQTQTQNENENEHDGAEVVSLLLDPSFQPGLVTWDVENQDEMDTSNNTHGLESGLGFDLDDDPLDIEGFPRALAGLSPAEMQIIDSFRQRQQQPHHHQEENEQQPQKKITGYSLIPDIDSFLAITSTSSMNDDALRNEVITNLIGAEEWMNVDERYNDEVWGYLRPAVEAAAVEIQQQKEENTVREGDDGDGPAVKRLKMILRHMARL
jgi:hypothetical protein